MLPFAVQPPAVHSYTVKPGDSLWEIAKEEYGSPDKWPSIYDANLATIGHDPDFLLPAWQLTIPDDPTVTYEPKHSAEYVPTHAQPAPILTSGEILSPAEVGELWLDEGGPAWAETEAECIAYNESGDNFSANNYTDNDGTQTSWGGFQISNGTHEEPVPDIDNPIVNTRQAVIKFEAEGDSFYPDWGTAGDC